MLTEAQLEAVRALARQHGWRLVVLFGSSVTGAGRDMDLAILSGRKPEGLEIGGWQADLEEVCAPKAVDMVLLDERTSPLLRYEILCRGQCLYESEPGLFEREQDRAFFLHADSAHFRRALSESLHEAYR